MRQCKVVKREQRLADECVIFEARYDVSELHDTSHSIDAHGFGAGEIDALDLRGGCKPCDILRERPTLHAFLEILGDPVPTSSKEVTALVLRSSRMMWNP